jgi:hypothetical protein
MIVKIDMRDEIWGNSAYGTDSPDAWPYLYSTENNDNISIERAYLSHKFGENTTLDVGLMSVPVVGDPSSATTPSPDTA